MMKLRDKTKTLTMDQSYTLVMMTIRWCEKFFTPPHTKRRSSLCVMVHCSPAREVYGEYCERRNWLTINLSYCENVKDIVKTTIHEYTHFCQDLKEYSLMTKQVGYDDNPFEVEARYNEDTYYTNCWRSIKKDLL